MRSPIRYLCAFAALLIVSPSFAETVPRNVLLTWTPSTTCDDGSALTNCPTTGYVVEHKLPSESTYTALSQPAATVFTYTHAAVAPGIHQYRIIAKSLQGNSAPSNVASIAAVGPNAPTLSVKIEIVIAVPAGN